MNKACSSYLWTQGAHFWKTTHCKLTELDTQK